MRKNENDRLQQDVSYAAEDFRIYAVDKRASLSGRAFHEANIFKYPELSDNSKASELIYTLEEKQLLAELVNDSQDNDSSGIKVYIGKETPIDSMKDCSVVTATYELEDGAKGTIGIIGPKRMDYEKVVSTINNIKTQLDDVFKK